MVALKADRVKELTGGHWVNGVPSSVSSFSFDSRNLKRGDIFIAIKTSQRDGHAFLRNACESGASGAIVSHEDKQIGLPQLVVDNPLKAFQAIASHWRQGFDRPVIGITGTVGKTSTKELLALLLGGDDVHRSQGNYNNEIGVPLSLLEIDFEHHKCSVIEAGANQLGEIEVLAEMIDPSSSIITALTPVHLEGFGSLEQTAREKAMLGQYTRPDGIVIFPHECSRFGSFDSFPATSVMLVPENFSGPVKLPTDKVALWSETRTSPPAGGCRLQLRQPPTDWVDFELPFASPGMVRNAALAIIMARQHGVDDVTIRERLRLWKAARYRGETVQLEEKIFFVDCYNASPASMVDAFTAFADSMPAEQPRLYILGCMAELGDQSPEIHRETGSKLQLRAKDKAFLIGEDAGSFREGVLDAGNDPTQAIVVNSLDEIRDELDWFKGCVLLKGSRAYHLEELLPENQGGHETERRKAC